MHNSGFLYNYDKVTHTDTLTLENIECKSPHCNADHALRVVEELDSLSVEGEVPQVLIVEEVYGVCVELERESLEE